LLEAGNTESALTDLGAIPEHARTPEHVLVLARAKLLSGRRESEVEDCFAEGLKRFPQDFRLRLAFGRYLASRRGPDPSAARRAVSVLQDLVESEDPQAPLPRIQAEALFLLGELAAETADLMSQAETYYHRGLALLPDDPRGLTGIGALMIEQGRPAHGLPWLLQSILIDPERPQTLEYLAKALTAVPDDEAVARWIGLVTAGLPGQSPTLLTHLLRFVQEAGRADAYEEVRREGHRMKNLVAVLASRLGPGLDPAKGKELDKLYREWAAFLERIQLPSPSPSLLSVSKVVRQALQQAVGDTNYIRCQLPTDLPQVRGEEAGLVDALANILRNAVEASGDSPPPRNSIRLAVRHREGSRWLEIIVTDEGRGIELEDQKRIFDPGFSRREGGSGLGLAIAQRVVMAHGGRISLASAPGGPTTFVIRLPVATRSTTDQLLRYQTRTFHASSGRGYRRPEANTKETDHAGQGHAG
jgi:signal transduction histidine kinase